jgi:DNA-binding PadR family transcriptional regulator
LNKYRIEKVAKVARQTLYTLLSRMRTAGWVEVASTGTSRVGLPVEYYRLTKLGLFRAATMNPDLTSAVRSVFGAEFEEFEKRRQSAPMARFRQELSIAEQVFERRTAPPNWFLTIQLKADEHGHVQHWFKTGIKPLRVQRSLRE